MLVVHPSLPINNLKEFIEYSKAQPAGLDYATSGPGTSTHLAAEMFKAMTGAKLVHVPFKGNAEVINALRRRPCEGAFRADARRRCSMCATARCA